MLSKTILAVIDMQISSGVILAIRAAYRSGVINFETYEEIKKKYGF
nr:hypothetical protein [uncultured Lachnoclostridium sp.]